jgi:DNA-binding transcriptional MerR regulator
MVSKLGVSARWLTSAARASTMHHGRCRLGHRSDYDFTAAAVAGIRSVRTRMMMPGAGRDRSSTQAGRLLWTAICLLVLAADAFLYGYPTRPRCWRLESWRAERACRCGRSVSDSDRGVLPPAGRTDGGYRLYGTDALARLGLVRTLRELGIDLATIRRVLEREVTVAEVAAAHAAALEAQIRILRVRTAVLRAVDRRGSDPLEMERMHRLTRLSDDERRRIVADFLDHAFEGLDIAPGFADRMRSATPDLSDNPTPERVDAWIELAELIRDDDFRQTIRRMSEQHAAAREAGAGEPTPGHDWNVIAALVADGAERGHAAAIAPGSQDAARILDEIVPAFAGPADHPADPAFRARLADRLAAGTDARAERYWQLLAIINDWPPVPTTVPAWHWLIEALRADRKRGSR